jgi:hypothetical protein
MPSQKFRKKPVVIEAITVRGALHGFGKDWMMLPDWLEEHYNKGGVVPTPTGIHLPTLEGTMFAAIDDWIICGVKGEIYPCKPDVFAATYERADNEPVTVDDKADPKDSP